MSKTSNVFARVEPDIKMQAEQVLSDLGLPMSNAINLFLKQVVLQRGLPFEVKMPIRKPISVASLSKEQLDAELNKGLNDLNNGRVLSAKEFEDSLHRDYGI